MSKRDNEILTPKQSHGTTWIASFDIGKKTSPFISKRWIVKN
jgi:hypothetical protein